MDDRNIDGPVSMLVHQYPFQFLVWKDASRMQYRDHESVNLITKSIDGVEPDNLEWGASLSPGASFT